MATLIAKASGNLTDASTWEVADSTSLNATGTTNTALTTSYVQSTAFTPGAITVDAIAVFVGTRVSSPTGTLSVGIFQAGVLVTGTDVTINVSDLPNYNTYVSGVGIGWVLFKFASPVSLIAATAYTIGAKTSSSTQATLVSLATTNWLRALRTTTTQAPVAADNLIVCGEWTAAGIVSSLTVTMNETATTAYGQIDVCDHGLLLYGSTASTAYYLKTKDVFVRAAGILRIGTSGTPIPSSSSAVLELASTSAAQYGLVIYSLGTFEAYGATKKSWTNLTADVAVSGTSMNVTDNTGWAISDDVVFTPTARTYSQFEKRTIATVGTNTFTISAGTTNAHTGTGTHAGQSLAGQVGNLTRNVKIRGLTTSNTGYVRALDTASFSASYTQFNFLGGVAAPKSGIYVETTTGAFTINHCSIADTATSSALALNTTTSTNNWTCNDCVMYSPNLITGVTIATTANTNIFFTDNLVVGWNSGIIVDTAFNITFTGNRACGCLSACLTLSNGSSIVDYTGTFNTNVFNTGGTQGISFALAARSFTFGSSAVYFNGNGGMTVTGTFLGSSAINSYNGFGNTNHNFSISGSVAGELVLNDFKSNSHSTFTTAAGLLLSGTTTNTDKLIIRNGMFGDVVTHTNDIDVAVGSLNARLEMDNTRLNASTEVNGQAILGYNGYITSQKHDQTAGVHKLWKRFGMVSTDSVIYDATSPSMRLTPNNASLKLQGGKFRVAALSGTTISPSIRLRKSVVGDGTAYNGNQPRLILLANIAAGISADTFIATATNAANGAWETLSGTTATVSDNAILEFIVDCDGTTGWINVDNFIATGASTTDLAYWSKGEPQALVGAAGGTSQPKIVISRMRKVLG